MTTNTPIHVKIAAIVAILVPFFWFQYRAAVYANESFVLLEHVLGQSEMFFPALGTPHDDLAKTKFEIPY